MQDRPTALELLAAVRAFLEDDVVPSSEGRKRFHAMVAANVLGIVERELDGEQERLVEEWRSLAGLLEHGASMPTTLAGLRRDVAARTSELAERIRRGEADNGPFAARVRAHVREAVVEKLQIANPRFVRSADG